MQQLQGIILSRTSFKTYRAHLKTCLDEATELIPLGKPADPSRELVIWQYSFLLARLQHSHPNPDTHEITQHTIAIHNLRNLAQRNSDYEILELSYLLEIRHALQFNITSVNIENLLTLASDVSTKNPVRQNHMQLSLMRILLHILYLTKLGNGTAAIAKLREHHQVMDLQVANDSYQWQSDGKFDLVILNGQHKLHFEWFTQAQSFVFGYILSGVVNLSDHSNVKACNFLLEGNRVVDGTFSPRCHCHD